jgi:hypothetical protein
MSPPLFLFLLKRDLTMLTPASRFASYAYFIPQADKKAMPFCNTPALMEAYKTHNLNTGQVPWHFAVPEEAMTVNLAQELANKVSAWVKAKPAELASLDAKTPVAYIASGYKFRHLSLPLANLTLNTLDPPSNPNLGQRLIDDVKEDTVKQSSIFSPFWLAHNPSGTHKHEEANDLIKLDLAGRSASPQSNWPDYFSGFFVLASGKIIPVKWNDDKDTARLIQSKLDASA